MKYDKWQINLKNGTFAHSRCVQHKDVTLVYYWCPHPMLRYPNVLVLSRKKQHLYIHFYNCQPFAYRPIFINIHIVTAKSPEDSFKFSMNKKRPHRMKKIYFIQSTLQVAPHVLDLYFPSQECSIQSLFKQLTT